MSSQRAPVIDIGKYLDAINSTETIVVRGPRHGGDRAHYQGHRARRAHRRDVLHRGRWRNDCLRGGGLSR